MTGIDGKRLTDSEFKGYHQDILNSYIRKIFKPNEPLLFVSYQPHELTLDATIVAGHTRVLLGSFRYVEVIEQTYRISNRYNTGKYMDGYHSHLIVRESDYCLIEDQLADLDIVTKRIYNEESLKEYLSKQAGYAYHRLLPTMHQPQEDEGIRDMVVVRDKQIIVSKIKAVLIKVYLDWYWVAKHLKTLFNRLKRFQMYVDDT